MYLTLIILLGTILLRVLLRDIIVRTERLTVLHYHMIKVNLTGREKFFKKENLLKGFIFLGKERESSIGGQESISFKYIPDKNIWQGKFPVPWRAKDGVWTQPVNLGAKINTEHAENRAYVSPDGKYLFFTSDRNGTMDAWWVDVRILEKLKIKH